VVLQQSHALEVSPDTQTTMIS